jgi:peptidoglycan/LPS O-acetylase OafA/YrhL
LNWAPLTFIGVLSYSLYLWQQLFLNGASSAWINAFPQNLILAFCAAVASHYLIEKPFLSLRDRYRKSAKERKPTTSAAAIPIQATGQVSDV